ncbi:hypothetical protein, partial [Streptomyces lavenduligriseus]
FLIANSSAPGTHRLVNRYSGLVLGLSAAPGRLAETAAPRTWTAPARSPGDGRTAAEQTLTFTPSRA